MKFVFGIVAGTIFLGMLSFLAIGLFGELLVQAATPANPDEGGTAIATGLLFFGMLNAVLLGVSMGAMAISDRAFKKAILIALLVGGALGLFEFLVMARAPWLMVLIEVGLTGFLSCLAFIFVRWLKQVFYL